MSLVAPRGHERGCFCDWCMAVRRARKPSYPSVYGPTPPSVKLVASTRHARKAKSVEARVREQIRIKALDEAARLERAKERHPSTYLVKREAETLLLEEDTCRFCSGGNGPLCDSCQDSLTGLRDWLTESRSH
jgi:hypothetical protein